MLTITVGATDVFDEATNTFGKRGGVELQLEHSLLSLSKWEAKFERPFLGELQKSGEEVLFYIECMVISGNPPKNFVTLLSEANHKEIVDYIDAKMSATWFSEQPGQTRTGEVITSELIYYWMTQFRIPFVCENWHLNRLFTLIRISNVKQQKPKKMSRSEVARRQRELNEKRKAELGTSG